MRQTHTPGERLFIDYAGQTVGVTDDSTGEIRNAQVFVAVLGAVGLYLHRSHLEPALAGLDRQPQARARLLRRLYRTVGARQTAQRRDTASLRAGRHPTHHDLDEHYGVAVLPARTHRPKDKAKVEKGVLVVTRSVLARLRHQRFFSLNDLNRSLRTLLTGLNQRPFKKPPGSRANAFVAMDQPARPTLPEQHYGYAEWKVARVGVCSM